MKAEHIMQIERLSSMKRGWFIGDFDPSVFRSPAFEVGILTHSRGEIWPTHYHKIATEYNVLLSGSMTINGYQISVNDIFILEPGEVASPVFLTDCVVLCVKVPSLPSDKYIVEPSV